MKKTILFLFLITSTTFFSQQKTIEVHGVTSDLLGNVMNVHVVNLTSKQATFSDDTGKFVINSKLGDKLKITSVQHYPKIITLTKAILKYKSLRITLSLKDNLLEEVNIKKTYLTGSLAIDIKESAKDFESEKSEKALDFSKVQFKEKIFFPGERESNMIGDIDKSTDPVLRYTGLNLARFQIFTKSKKLTEQIKRDAYNAQLPSKIINLLGKKFFTQNLNIPEIKIFRFISSSLDEELKSLYRNKKYLELIDKLNYRSKLFLKETNEDY